MWPILNMWTNKLLYLVYLNVHQVNFIVFFPFFFFFSFFFLVTFIFSFTWSPFGLQNLDLWSGIKFSPQNRWVRFPVKTTLNQRENENSISKKILKFLNLNKNLFLLVSFKNWTLVSRSRKYGINSKKV